jgi:hypothetical protein
MFVKFEGNIPFFPDLQAAAIAIDYVTTANNTAEIFTEPTTLKHV